MPHQVAVTVRATIEDAHRDEVRELLEIVRNQGPGSGLLPFARMSEVHFARLFILEEVTDPVGDVIPASLVYMADVDGSVASHLQHLGDTAPAGVDQLFGHCVGYPLERTEQARFEWLHRHLLAASAYYVHNVGRTVSQVRDEAELRESVGRLLDRAEVPEDGAGARAVRRRVQKLVLGRPEHCWAARPPRGPDLRYRASKFREIVTVVVPATLLLPVLLPVAAGWLIVVRLLEAKDRANSTPPDPGHVREVETYEDVVAQNPFTAVGFVKPGSIRRTTMKVALRGLDVACRQVYHRDNLAGVRSIHFARWLPIDDGRRAVFASSYDDTLESYMDDFIDRVAWGVNLVFSNGVGYPRTRWLVFGGARDELTYKRHLRRHQVPTVVFYSAYPTLPAPTVDANTRLRRGLTRAMDDDEAQQWLALL